MNTVVTPEIREVVEEALHHPAVSVFMPFEPKMRLKRELVHSLEIAAVKVEKELLENYPAETGTLVMQKLNIIFRRLNFDTYKKSIAIYVSPVFEKVFYLDFAVDEKIIVDKSFEIRDLVYSKMQLHKYLVLLMNGKQSLMYAGNSSSLVRIVSNTAISFYDWEDDVPVSGAHFSDSGRQKEVITNKFLHHIDNVLDIILNAYHQPLFVLADENITGYFKKLTKHGRAVVAYLPGNYEEVALAQLKKILEPHIADWEKVKQKDLLNQLEIASCKSKLAAGMKAVLREAIKHNGRLLVVEKNYVYAEENTNDKEIICKATEPYNKSSYIKNEVDDVIEKVLENGGDIEFVAEGVLKEYHQIALIQ